MLLLDETAFGFGPIFGPGAAWAPPGKPMNLKLHFDDDPAGFVPARRGARDLAWTPRLAPLDVSVRERVIAGAQQTLDRMDRQLANLRDLLGPDLGGPGGARAA